jgi:hypothetical protein
VLWVLDADHTAAHLQQQPVRSDRRGSWFVQGFGPVEVADLHTQCLGEALQATSREAVDACLVLVQLLVGDPD